MGRMSEISLIMLNLTRVFMIFIPYPVFLQLHLTALIDAHFLCVFILSLFVWFAFCFCCLLFVFLLFSISQLVSPFVFTKLFRLTTFYVHTVTLVVVVVYFVFLYVLHFRTVSVNDFNSLLLLHFINQAGIPPLIASLSHTHTHT